MILFTYGTRPEYIKLQPLINHFNKKDFPFKILFTGQQKDLLKKQKVDFQLKIPENNNNRLNEIIKSTMTEKFSQILKDLNPSHILVQGDTTSVLAVALSAFNHGIKVIHLEAGLRTYNNANPYPEEQNRKLVSQITDIHLCPTELNRENLENERILGDKYVVGNTVLDNLLPYKNECEYTNKVLITMHRRENHHWLDKWFKEINDLAISHPELEFIIPLHPNPNVQKHKYLLKNIKVINPLSYDEMIKLLVKTRIVITDSGGLQEECSFFNKKCLTCRVVTERPETINKGNYLVKTPENLKILFEKHYNDPEINYICPFGDGHSAEKIYQILKDI